MFSSITETENLSGKISNPSSMVKSLIPLASAKDHGNYDTGTSNYQYQYFQETKEALLTPMTQRLPNEGFLC